jgi:signal transduction histidine kinase
VKLGAASGRLRGDRDLLFQALCNLLDNAIKFSPPGSEVMLEVTESDHAISISITDQGPGIPEAERGKVLDRFYRSASVAGIPGSGLGLSLVSAIAHYHGGQLLLSDNAPGLRATLRLPAPAAVIAAPFHQVAVAGLSR